MVIQFRDRKEELRELDNILESATFEFIVIYGRRRVGKTELILNATKNKKRIYYLASGENNLGRFHDTCIKFDENSSKLRADWEILFDSLKEKAEVIIIDEFQNMISENKNILNTFQIITDIILKGSKMKLILLGSSVSIITSRVLSYKSPLYGRRTGSINLKPVSFFDLPEFFPGTSFENIVNIFGFADGIPYYLVKIKGNFWNWLKDEIEEQKSFLKDEVDFLVRYEFSDPGTYKLILEAISNGCTKLNEIKNFIKVRRTDITPYLKNLIDVGFVKRNVPITENIKSRMGRYEISDNFIRFWFRFIYPNASSIEEGIFDISIIKNNYNQYLGRVFEKICRQHLLRFRPFEFTKMGRWWFRDNEIDIVAMNENRNDIFFIECKWKKNVNAEKIIQELKEKAKHVRWRDEIRKEHYVVYAKSFKRKYKTENCFLFDLKDIGRGV